jgi:hypothetical protein
MSFYDTTDRSFWVEFGHVDEQKSTCLFTFISYLFDLHTKGKVNK